MLRQTFSHIPGLGGHTERSLWKQGCLDWQTYLDDPSRFEVAGAGKEVVRRGCEEAVQAFDAGHHQYFSKALGTRESWRAWPEFKDRAVYLDIETDGGQSGDSITTVGMYDGNRFICLVKDQDLGEFPNIISNYSMIVTFFGAGFDIPMLKRAFPVVPFDQIHLDLCYAFKKVGVRGGLKKIEKQMGIARGDDTDGLTGLDAIRLWRQYQYGDESALRTLIEYNKEDVVNLEVLAGICYSRLRAATFQEAGVVDGQLPLLERPAHLSD